MSTRGKVVSLITPKGGVGKTTIIRIIGMYMRSRGYTVGLVDSDPRRRAYQWFLKAREFVDQMAREGTPVEDLVPNSIYCPATAANMIKLIKLLSKGGILEQSTVWPNLQRTIEVPRHDLVLVDTGGFENQEAIYAAGAADFVLIPAAPSEDDMESSFDAVKTVESAIEMSAREIGYAILMNKVKLNTTATKHAIGGLAESGVPVFPEQIPDLVAFAEMSFGYGLPRKSAARHSIRLVCHALEEILGLELEEAMDIETAAVA